MRYRKRFVTDTDKIFYKLDRENIWLSQGKKCYYCKIVLPKNKITFDHVTPISATGRTHSVSNCVVSCFDCNQKKGSQVGYEHKLEPWEIQLAEGLARIDHNTRKSMYRIIRYSGCEDAKGSFSKWHKFWEKKKRFK